MYKVQLYILLVHSISLRDHFIYKRRYRYVLLCTILSFAGTFELYKYPTYILTETFKITASTTFILSCTWCACNLVQVT